MATDHGISASGIDIAPAIPTDFQTGILRDTYDIRTATRTTGITIAYRSPTGHVCDIPKVGFERHVAQKMINETIVIRRERTAKCITGLFALGTYIFLNAIMKAPAVLSCKAS